MAYPFPYEGEVVEERRCREGHPASLQINTSQGGCICLLCFSNLIIQSSHLFTHKAYAISQFSQALNDDTFRNIFLQNHRHFLVSPLSHAICHSTDHNLAKDMAHLLINLCTSANSQHNHDDALLQDIILHLVLQLTNSTNSLLCATNTQTTINALHCLGLLTELHCNNCNALPNGMRNHKAFISNLVSGLRLPSDEMRGEILFVLYKLSNLEDGVEELLPYCPRMIHLAVKALIDTQSDELRTNCVALLTGLARAAVFQISLEASEDADDVDLMDNVETTPPQDDNFVRTFVEAIKGALLSSDVQLQISTLQLIYYACPVGIGIDINRCLHILVEEGTTDYIFEVLRLSENMEPLVVWCVRVLSLLSAAEETFTKRFLVGFSTICRLIGYLAEIPLHPAQTDTLLLISAGISNCPGIVSTAQAEEIMLILAKMLSRHSGRSIGLSSDAFNAACSTLVALLKTPSCRGIKCLTQCILEAVNNAISSCSDGRNLLCSLNLLKEAYIFTLNQNNNNSSPSDADLEKALVETCEIHLIPSVARISEDEKTLRELLQTFYFILRDTALVPTAKFAEKLAVSSWFSFSFECLARFPSNDVKHEIFLIFGLLIDRVVGDGMGECVREAASYLPSDPLDLLFLLGQKSSSNLQLLSNQSAIISILYASYLYGDRLANDNQVLASLEHYILVNASNFSCGLANSETFIQIVQLYAFVREPYALNYHGSTYSVEAEKLLLRVMTIEIECHLLSARMPKVVLRWLFQHEDEDIQEFLRVQILNFCRFMYKTLERGIEEGIGSTELDALDNRNNGGVFLHEYMTALAELIDQEDCGTVVVVSVLHQLVETCAEDDLRAVLHILVKILNIFPAASNRFHAHSIVGTLHRFYRSKVSPQTFTSCALLVFNILYFVKPETVIEDDLWLGITNQMLEMLVARLRDKNSSQCEGILLFSIVTLILQKSGSQEGLLTEAAKAVVLHTQLGSAVEGIIEKACERGPRLAQIGEHSGTGEILVSALVFHLFWLRRFRAVLEQSVDWHDSFFMDCYEVQNGQQLSPDLLTSDKYDCLPIKIQCHHLCRLLYFGTPLIKLVTSYSLAELFSHIADWKKTDESHNPQRELKCSPGYLQSVVMVLQGFILQGDNIWIARNAAACVYWLLGCQHLNAKQKKAVEGSKWYRLFLEELALCLATPNSVYCSFKSGENPAAYIGIALLRLCPHPGWVKSVLSGTCISSIIENLSSYKPTPEIVVLFRELLRGGYIEQAQISKLQHLFQAVRRYVYMENPYQDRIPSKHDAKLMAYTVVDCSTIISVMIDLAMRVRVDALAGIRTHTLEEEEELNRELLAEIDEFLQTSAAHA